MQETPLISVIVVTYNSANFVLETLESIADQTYKNIELIISDDCSSDNTLELCQNWIDSHHDRFVNTKILSVQKNGGIPANCNRGVKASSGEWIKLIAGDDILLKNCIEDNINFVKEDNQKKVVQSFSAIYKNSFQSSPIDIKPEKEYDKFFHTFSAKEQHAWFVNNNNCIYAPSIFLKREIFEKYGFYDEQYRLLEDFPMWLKLTRNGEKIHLLPVATVGYRIHESIMNFNTNIKIYNKLFEEDIYRLKKNEIYPYIPRTNIMYYQAELWNRVLFLITINFFDNKNSKFQRCMKYLIGITTLKNVINKLRRISNG